jgi:hypothetical protein
MFLFISETVDKLIEHKAENTPLQRFADRCQQAEGGSSYTYTLQEMERNFLRFLKSRTNEQSTCKQYVVTDLGIITKALKSSLSFSL